MKATGIVRRIDDLGRIVIPKEIRRTMRIREGDPLEIFTDRDGEVIFKKYSPVGELGSFASQYAETLAKVSGRGVCITDKDMVSSMTGLENGDELEYLVVSEPMMSSQAYSLVVAKVKSGASKGETVATITEAQLREVAETKLPDLNAYDVEHAMKIVEGTARNMGIEVEK